MSKVKIQGNASGTGVLTVTAPNTSTDRTITLPDGDVTLGAATPSIDDNGNATAITIDSSENVLIGKTTTALATVGLTLGESGFASITRDGYEPLNVNRLNSDGNVISVYKDSVVKGSIAVTGSGIGIQLGGTAAANTLDDYEEGTWTGTLTGSSSAPSSAQTNTGTYTKIGRQVYVHIYLDSKNTTGASGEMRITGLPFNPSISAVGTYASYGLEAQGAFCVAFARTNGTVEFLEMNDGAGWQAVQIVAGNYKYIDLAMTYET